MKGIWAGIANKSSFDDEFEDELNKENPNFTTLETDVNNILAPYLQAHEFLSWTLATMDKTLEKDEPVYPEAGYDDIVLEEYLDGAVIIMNLDQWLSKADSEIQIDMEFFDPDVEKRRILAFKDYCKEHDLNFRRIFIKSTNEVPNSITNDGLVTFRKKMNEFIVSNKIKKQFLNIKYELKPIAPLFASFKSYQFVVGYINDACIQSQFDVYLQTAVGLEKISSSEDRLKAIGKILNFQRNEVNFYLLPSDSLRILIKDHWHTFPRINIINSNHDLEC